MAWRHRLLGSLYMRLRTVDAKVHPFKAESPQFASVWPWKKANYSFARNDSLGRVNSI